MSWTGFLATGFDLYLNIDDGLRYQVPAELRPSACWAIDTHLDPGVAPSQRRDNLTWSSRRSATGRKASAARASIIGLAAVGLRSGDPPQARGR